MVRWRRYDTIDENTRNIQDASRDAFDEIDVERPFGIPKSISASTSGKLGVFYFIEQPGDDVNVELQQITAADVGKVVSVKVSTLAPSTKTYTVKPSGTSVTIDGFSYRTLNPGDIQVYMVLTKTLWVQVI